MRFNHAATYLPSAGQETEGTCEKGSPGRKAAAPVYAPRGCAGDGWRWHANISRHAGSDLSRDFLMRLPPSPEASRLERADRLRRERAAAIPMRVAFPGIRLLRIELTFESSSVSTPTPQLHVLHPAARAFFDFRCPYADCDGGFDLTPAVSAALANQTGTTRGTLECSGDRPERHSVQRPCNLRLRYTIAATYQTSE